MIVEVKFCVILIVLKDFLFLFILFLFKFLWLILGWFLIFWKKDIVLVELILDLICLFNFFWEIEWLFIKLMYEVGFLWFEKVILFFFVLNLVEYDWVLSFFFCLIICDVFWLGELVLELNVLVWFFWCLNDCCYVLNVFLIECMWVGR